jgi:hypothetical protein
MALYISPKQGVAGPSPAALLLSADVSGCPYHGAPAARVSRISASGERTTVVDGLPSGLTSSARCIFSRIQPLTV